MIIKILGNKMRLEIIVLCMVIGGVLACNVFCSCAGGVKEGYRVAMGLPGAMIELARDNSPSILAKLETNTLEPSTEFEKTFFAQNTMSPSCCPSTYSGSSGCVCETPEQMKYLMMRGGNNTEPE
jgi:hypothetical protein